MKAIKDCEWKVKIEGYTGGSKGVWSYNWIANFPRASGVEAWTFAGGTPYLQSRIEFATKLSAKRNWEHFAKINGIKKWKYI